jgi:hypothetical protein
MLESGKSERSVKWQRRLRQRHSFGAFATWARRGCVCATSKSVARLVRLGSTLFRLRGLGSDNPPSPRLWQTRLSMTAFRNGRGGGLGRPVLPGTKVRAKTRFLPNEANVPGWV